MSTREYVKTETIRITLTPNPPDEEADEIFEDALDAYCCNMFGPGDMVRLTDYPDYMASYVETFVWTLDGEPLSSDLEEYDDDEKKDPEGS